MSQLAHPHADRTNLGDGISLTDRLLTVRFTHPQRVLSWAIVNGGARRSQAIVWRHVLDEELGVFVDPAALLRQSLESIGLPDAVGLLTSRALHTFEQSSRSSGELSARCLTTVGLGNALAAGDAPGPLTSAGTINTLCQISAPLSEAALVEAVALVTEARTAALLEAQIPSRRSAHWASGTGTDCVVVACAEASTERATERYVGKHTTVGALIGAAVREATARGIQRWIAERGGRG